MLMCLAMYKAPKRKELLLCFTVLKFILIQRFMKDSLLGFYIFFELSLIPTLIIILGWGIQPERIRAGSYLMIYTVGGSFPLLVCLVYMEFHCGSVKVFVNTLDVYFFSG